MSGSDTESDDDLRRAIALSLLDVTPSTAHKEPAVIDLVSDEDIEDLDQPPLYHAQPESEDALIARRHSTRQVPLESNGLGFSHSNADLKLDPSGLSDRHSISQHTAPKNSLGNSQPSATRSPEISAALQAPKTFLGLDRKKMEEERLARMSKRKASISPPPPRNLNTALDIPSLLADQEERRALKRVMVRSTAPPVLSDMKNDGATFSVPSELIKPKTVDSIQSNTDEDPDLLEAIKASLMENQSTLQPKALPVSSENQNARVLKSPTAGLSRVEGVQSYLQQQDLLAPGIHFPDGVVKKTWARGFPRIDDIKIEEVLQKNDLELAVLSAFQWDEEWIVRKLDLHKTKLVCVVQAKEETQRAEMRANAPPFIKFCFPPMDGQINCMHSKLQLLSHPTHLRIVVPSANLVPYDWGEDGGVMENIVFMIDLPRLPGGQTKSANALTPFGRELRRFLVAMGMDEAITNSILKFDFTRTSHLAFVHTIGGSHSEQSWRNTGYCGLGSAIKELGLASNEPLDVEFVSASIGSLTETFIRSIYLAAKGDDGMIEYNWRNNKKSLTQLDGKLGIQDENQIQREVDERFRIYYPTHETVANSKGGVGGGGTICLSTNAYDNDRFPKNLMRDCRSRRAGLLMHNKMLFARPTGTVPWQVSCNGQENLILAWAYVGSANLSESAWGRLVKDSKSKLPKLNCRNWECGVVVPVKAGSSTEPAQMVKGKDKEESERRLMLGEVTMEVFKDVVPVPMVVPGEEYAGRRPWFRDQWRGAS